MLHMGYGRNVGVNASGEEGMRGEQPLRDAQQLARQVAGPVPQTLLLSTLSPYFPISIKVNRPELPENDSEAHTYMLELSKNILRDTKLVEFWLDGMDDIVYHSTIYGRLNENTGVNTTPTTTNSGSVSSSPLSYSTSRQSCGQLATPFEYGVRWGELMAKVTWPFYTTCKSMKGREIQTPTAYSNWPFSRTDHY